MTEGKKPERRRGIQSVEIGLRVLSSVVGFPGPTTLSAIAQRASLSPSQTHRYLSSLVAAGMVKQEGRSGLYDLDAEAIRIGLAALARLDIFREADQAFSRFAVETGRTCLIAVWGDGGPTIVRWFPGSPPVVTSLAIGSILPLAHSATGHIFLAFGDEGAISAHLGKSGRSTQDLDAIRQEVRRRYRSRVAGDLIPGLRAMSAPVFDLQGRLALVATALTNNSVDPNEDAATAEALAEVCSRLTQALGGRWPQS